MSIGNEDLSQILQPGEINPASSRQSKISYSRKFLLSLSNLEICKTLPKGFSEPLLSEIGSSPLQGFRRNDYSSSPPEKGETCSFSRGVDRWDSRASGRSDTDSHSDRDSDSGRRYGTQVRRPWQNSEHDGLLGSGSLPRPPGLGSPVPNSRANNQSHLKKSSDPYHPPRPFKAAPHPRRETKDSYNDETFGWGENTSEDRSEEEIKRRAEFEMMRKEQHKELKMKSDNKLKDDPMIELAASNGGEAVITNDLDTSVIKILQQNDSGKTSVCSQDHQIRPLVPPGFANAAAVEKFSGPKSLEVGKLELGHVHKDEKSTPMCLDYSNCEITSSFVTEGGIQGLVPSLLELPSKTMDSGDHSFRAPNILETSNYLRSGNMATGSENLNGLNVMGEAGHSTSILEKLFGGTLSSPPITIEDQNMKSDDAWSPKDSQCQTSKFVHLFLDDEKNLPESGTLEKSNGLLSLIGGEKSRLLASEPAEKTLAPLSNLLKLTTTMPKDGGISEVLCSKKAETVPAFLTCEDLEQSILSNVGESSSSARPPQICVEHGTNDEIEKEDIDKNASQHLLSLLQMGTSVNSNSMPPISMVDKGFPTETQNLDNVRDEGAENIDSGKGLTLETLFGTAFMKELKSADVPVSLQWNSSLPSLDVSEPSMPPLVVSNDKVVTSDATFKRVSEEDYISRLGGRHQTNLYEEIGVNWLNVGGPQNEIGSLNSASYGMRLPEEDSLASNALMFPSSSNAAATRGERSTLQRQFLEPIRNAQSSPQFNSGPMNHGRPMFHHLDPHPPVSIDPQFNVMPHGGIPHQDVRIHHQFPANVGHASYRHPGRGLSEFDQVIHPMLQQPHMPNNNFLPLHPGGNFPGYMEDHNLIHGFPFDRHQPNHGMRLGAEYGDTENQPPPQALQRILEMELRSSQKPMHHPGSGHIRPVYGHELDAGLWYS